MIGMLAFSRAGHDRDMVYMIVGEDAEYVYVSDGRLKPVHNPKKKNKKHIQPIKKGYGTAVGEKLLRGEPVSNEEIKKVIKDFKKPKEVADV